MEPVLSLTEAVKDYGQKRVGPVSFSVERGEIVGLLGPNGSGKSTSIRLSLGMARPTSGRVRLMGRDPVSEHSRALKGVGYSPELPNLQTFMTPTELLSLVGSEVSMPSAQLREEIPAALEKVGLLNYANYRIGKLSKGMVQRLSVAQAMLGSPTFLILDEPLIGIDPAGATHFRTLFRDYVSAGGTIILSSHILSEVENLCTSLAVLHQGRLIFRGAISEFISASLSSRTVHLEVGSPPPGLSTSISAIKGVTKVTLSPDGLTIELEKGVDARAEISKVVVESGGQLLSIGYSRTELDDAFMASIRGSHA